MTSPRDRTPPHSVDHGTSASPGSTAEDPRRTAPRIDARVEIELWVNSRVDAANATTANLSAGGMFVSTPHPLPVGTIARFVLRLPEVDPIRGMAEVNWIRAHYESAERPNGMGMQFLRLPTGAEEALRRYLETHVTDAKRARVRVREQTL